MTRREAPPETKVEPVTETLHGVTIVDPYRWLEDGESPRVVAWTAQQNAYTERYMEDVHARKALRGALEDAFATGSVNAPSLAGPYAFWLEQSGDTDQPLLMVEPLDGSAPARTLLDINRLSTDGTIALDWSYPSPSGRLLAYGLSTSGDERSVLHVMEVATGRELGEPIEGTRAASLQWLPDESGFLYTRYPLAGTRYWPEVSAEDASYYRQVYRHVLGTDPAQDPRIFGADRAREEWATIDGSPDGRWLVATIFQGWSNSLVFIRRGDAADDAPWRLVAERPETLDQPLASDEWLYLSTNLHATRGRVVRKRWEDLDAPEFDATGDAWEPVIAEDPERVIRDVHLAGDRLVVHWLFQASSHLTIHDAAGAPLAEVALPTLGSVAGIGSSPRHDDVFAAFSSFAIPPTVLRLRAGSTEPQVFRSVTAAIPEVDTVVTLERARSHDGTEITLFVTHRRDLPRDGLAPAVLYGYGGFDVALTPDYARNIQPFLAAGGVYAVAHLRGGGEYGAAWHRAGMLDQKERVFEDFEAAADFLVSARYTAPERLAVMGGSNGGLLTGAAVVRFPQKIRAAVVRVPLLDMLRYPRFLIAKLWIPEYGDPEDPEAFRWLRSWSPYHNMPDEIVAPATLLMAAESDTRVDPMHARKFTALLQAHNTGPHPVLLRIETRAGHGAGKPRSKVVDEYVDIWSFLWRELRVPTPR
ncbi:MAG: S9 family peptidase [Deltaproteobacteria bacterium]|nr:S9 family peptidase [Deltaproteobacteria bacterium]